MLRKVHKHPAGSFFVYLPKEEWYNKHITLGWNGTEVNMQPKSQLIIKPQPTQNEDPYITTKTPLRLPLGGGGSDLPEYYTKFKNGFWISATINHYIHIILKKRFEEESKFVWAKTEYVKQSNQFTHPLLREVLTKHNLIKHIELISIGDLPARIGLGSSGAFTVGLLNAVHTYKKTPITPETIAEEAYTIERHTLNRKIGKQDQYITSIGGLREFHINQQGIVTSKPMKTSLKDLEKWVLLFYVNQRETNKEKAIQTLTPEDYMKTSSLTHQIYEALQSNNFTEYGNLLDQHWQVKQKGQPKRFFKLIELAKKHGVIGAKLAGAGGGGCIMAVCPPEKQEKVIQELTNAKLRHIPFNFTVFGSEVY